MLVCVRVGMLEHVFVCVKCFRRIIAYSWQRCELMLLNFDWYSGCIITLHINKKQHVQKEKKPLVQKSLSQT